MFVAKALEYTLRRVVLLTVNRSVLLQNTVDDIREGGQFRAFRWLASRYPGGSECRSIFLTVSRAMPNRLAASRWLRPSTWQASRTPRYRSTVYILPPSISKKIEGYRWQSFTPHRRSHTADEAEIVARIEAMCEEFEAYGYRRVGAALRHQGIIVNSKKVRRLMREHDLQPRRRKRFVATTDSDHDGPIFPNLAKDVTADGPNQLWVADITYVAIAVGFVYVAVILDAWSRRVVGYAISRSIDARLTIAALKAAIRSRRPPAGCIHLRIVSICGPVPSE